MKISSVNQPGKTGAHSQKDNYRPPSGFPSKYFIGGICGFTNEERGSRTFKSRQEPISTGAILDYRTEKFNQDKKYAKGRALKLARDYEIYASTLSGDTPTKAASAPFPYLVESALFYKAAGNELKFLRICAKLHEAEVQLRNLSLPLGFEKYSKLVKPNITQVNWNGRAHSDSILKFPSGALIAQ
jgi:hypothetical protein